MPLTSNKTFFLGADHNLEPPETFGSFLSLMALMRTRSQLNVSSLTPPPPPPSPIPRARGSRCAANDILTEIIERSVQVPELTLPESHSGGESCGSRHLIPAEIDFRLLTSRREGSVDRLVRSAREFGAFRVSYHGISGEELRSLVRESGRVFGVLEGRDTGFHRSVVGNRDEIVWVRSWKERMEWAREYIGPERYRCFRYWAVIGPKFHTLFLIVLLYDLLHK